MAYDTTEAELDAEREDADRLVAALKTALAFMRPEDREQLRATLICPLVADLSVGHIIDGALALHERTRDRRIY